MAKAFSDNIYFKTLLFTKSYKSSSIIKIILLRKKSAFLYYPIFLFNMSFRRAKFTPDEEYPDFSKHDSYMSRRLTKALYAKLRDKVTPNGFTLDDAIQTGVDNPGINNVRSMFYFVYFVLVASTLSLQETEKNNK